MSNKNKMKKHEIIHAKYDGLKDRW